MTEKLSELLPELAIIREVMKAERLTDAPASLPKSAVEDCPDAVALRAEVERLEKERDDWESKCRFNCRQLVSAMNERDATRAENERLHNYQLEVIQLQLALMECGKENERLREVLEKIASDTWGVHPRDIARAALQSKG